jgi:uncharacterized protein
MNVSDIKKLVKQTLLPGILAVLGLVLPGFKLKPAPAVKLDKALLWEISGNGLTRPSYLYGTIHAICPADMVLSETLRATMKNTNQLSLEIDMDDPGMMAAMLKAVPMKDGSTLKSLLSDQEYTKLSQYFSQTMGMDLQLVQNWKPIMLSSLLFTKMLDCQPQSYETTFMKMAKEQGKEVIGVETLENQLATLDQIPYKKQAELLLESLEKSDEQKKMFQQMVSLYKQQDIEGFQEIFKEASVGMDNFTEVLLVQRNKNWIPVIAREAKEMPTFFAVGAGHLSGDQGVIALLRQAGFTVKPVLQK